MTNERQPDLEFIIPDTFSLEFWRDNPTVERLLAAMERDSEGTAVRRLYLWLHPARELTIEEIQAGLVRTTQPERLPELDLYGDGWSQLHFWEGLKGLEHIILIQESQPEKDYPLGRKFG